jgi:hypothetical protein
VEYLCEPFVSFDYDKAAADVRQFLENKNFDTVGVRRDGLIVGYCYRKCLTSGILADHLSLINGSEDVPVLQNTASLLEAISYFETKQLILVATGGQVFGIITRGDLHKAPVRMWLFGIVTLIEMQLLRLLRKHYPEESWKKHLKQRLKKAEEMFLDRQRHNEHIDLADCLQFCDKADMFCKSDKLRSAAGFASKAQCDDFFKKIQTLRDELAHAQDISAGDWPTVIALTKRAEQILRKIEVE